MERANQEPSKAKEIKLYAQIPPIEKMNVHPCPCLLLISYNFEILYILLKILYVSNNLVKRLD